jgi:outer membrane receptor protein involved in Fe transport
MSDSPLFQKLAMSRNLRLCLLLVGSVIGASSVVFPANGNVKGKIVDLKTGEALPYANVVVVGSGRGTVTNEKGEYFVTGIPPGTYVLRVSLVGYQTLEAKRVVIESQETAVYDFRLASTDIQVEGVTVMGQAPLVDVMKTAGDQSFTRDKIEQIPNVKDVKDIIPLQAGVVKFSGQLFLRGGRANETQILIDGVPVNDVGGRTGTAGTSTANEQLRQLYSGNTTAGAGGALSVSANAIQSVSISSSGLDAEHGNAQSGVVNIITKEGGETYNASVQYRTGRYGGGDFDDRYYAANLGGPEPISTHLLPSLGLTLPGKATFFMSGTFDQSDGPYGFNKSQFYNPLRRKVKFSGFFGDIFQEMGMKFRDRQRNDFSFNTKITHTVTEADILSFSYRANASSTNGLSDAYSWREMADSSGSTARLVTQNVAYWTHVFGTNSLLRAHLSRLENQRISSVGGLNPTQYSGVTDINALDPSQDGFYDLGSTQSWSWSNTLIWNLKVDYNAQLHALHFVKTGIDYNYEHIQSTAISFPQIPSSDTSMRGLYPSYGKARWVSNNLPSRGAMYVQDNIGLSSINIHVGVRYDWFYLGKQVYDRNFVKRYERTINDSQRETPYLYADWVDYETPLNLDRTPGDPDNTVFRARSFWHAFTHGYFSPRLSVGYPISTRTVFYFNYGHFLQWPERNEFYRDPIVVSDADNYVGNPALKPQKTIQYEAGFDQLILDDLSLGIRGFYKDIFDLVSLRRGNPQRYVNLDYGSTRGFEIIFTKQHGDNWSGSLTYTYSLAKGRGSNPLEVQVSPQLFGLPREVRLPWDQQHTMNLFLGYRVGPREDYQIFGLPFNNWGVSFTWTYGSGFPYTPIDPSIQVGTLQSEYLRYTATGPYTSEVNASLFKGFTIVEKLNLVLSLDVSNLLNRRNVDVTSGFNRFTGRPIVFGDHNTSNQVIYSWGPQQNGQSFESRVPPFVFGNPRQVSLGMKLSWD